MRKLYKEKTEIGMSFPQRNGLAMTIAPLEITPTVAPAFNRVKSYSRKDVAGHIEGNNVYRGEITADSAMVGYIQGNTIYRGLRPSCVSAGYVNGNMVYGLNGEVVGWIEGDNIYRGVYPCKVLAGSVDFFIKTPFNLGPTNELAGAALLLLL